MQPEHENGNGDQIETVKKKSHIQMFAEMKARSRDSKGDIVMSRETQADPQ